MKTILAILLLAATVGCEHEDYREQALAFQKTKRWTVVQGGVSYEHLRGGWSVNGVQWQFLKEDGTMVCMTGGFVATEEK